MDFEVTIVLAASLDHAECEEALLEGFLAISPGRDVVVTQDNHEGQATIWLMLSADNAASASQVAIATLRKVPARHPLVPTAIHVDAVQAPARAA